MCLMEFLIARSLPYFSSVSRVNADEDIFLAKTA